MVRDLARRALRRVRRCNRILVDAIDPTEDETISGGPTVAPAEPPPTRQPIQVRPERTPNPDAMKFNVGVPMGSHTYNSAREAGDSPLAGLFAVGGVRAVFAVDDFVTVLREPGTPWDAIESATITLLEEVLA